jgi:hypothetical protein
MGGLSPVCSLLSTRSLDRLDSVDMLLPSKCPSWEEDYNPISDSLNDSSCISQVRVAGRSVGSGEDWHPGPTLLGGPQMFVLFSLCS